MHKELLSDRERELLNDYLETGKKGNGFRLLKMRIINYDQAITNDYQLIKKANKRFSTQGL